MTEDPTPTEEVETTTEEVDTPTAETDDVGPLKRAYERTKEELREAREQEKRLREDEEFRAQWLKDTFGYEIADDAPEEEADDDLELGLESFPEEFPVLPDLPELPPIPVDAPDPAFAASSEPAQADAAWSGSVKSALGEVFALAGQGDSLEPPVHPSPVVREAMADAAVDAAREDAALREDGPPVLASLEQMLAAVRARRAALSGSLDS